MRENLTISRKRDYLTNFFRRRSFIALFSAILALSLSFYGIIAGVIRTVEFLGINGFSSFIYYTMISNTLAGVSMAFVIPFAVEGIKRKRFVLPKWVSVLNYVSATSITITMVFVCAFMSWVSPYDAFGGINIVLHIFCPVLILIAFFQIENRYKYSIKDCLMGCLPFYIYIIVYFIEVIIIGEAKGGWPDIYQVQAYMPTIPAMLILLILGLSVSLIIVIISNYLTKKREKKMFSYWKEEIDPIEAKIEAYGLGNMMSQIRDENSILIPLDIIDYLAKKSSLNKEDLIKAYTSGLINGKKQLEGE